MKVFQVDKYFEKFEDVTPAILKQANVKLLLCDLDNTIRLHSDKEPTSSLKSWIRQCQDAGIKIAVVSNNMRQKTMQKFCDPLGIEFIGCAKKPSSAKLTKTIQAYGVQPTETVMLGDKWSTDVIAANLAKIRAWKVNHRRNI